MILHTYYHSILTQIISNPLFPLSLLFSPLFLLPGSAIHVRCCPQATSSYSLRFVCMWLYQASSASGRMKRLSLVSSGCQNSMGCEIILGDESHNSISVNCNELLLSMTDATAHKQVYSALGQVVFNCRVWTINLERWIWGPFHWSIYSRRKNIL